MHLLCLWSNSLKLQKSFVRVKKKNQKPNKPKTIIMFIGVQTEHMSVSHMCALPVEARRGYRWFWATVGARSPLGELPVISSPLHQILKQKKHRTLFSPPPFLHLSQLSLYYDDWSWALRKYYEGCFIQIQVHLHS